MYSYYLLTVANLNVYSQNVRGLRTKTTSFYKNVLCSSYDVVFLCETWLNSSIFDGELFDDRYLVYRRDRETSGFHRSKSGGGVLIAVSKHLSSRRMPEMESDCEDLWVELEMRENGKTPHKLLLCGVYLPPPIQKNVLDCYIDNANRILESNRNVLIMGDFK